MSDGLKISVSGFRGVVGEGLTGEEILRFVAGFVSCRPGRIVIGRDSRLTGEAISRIVCGTVLLMGSDVVELGIVPTPTVGIMVRETNAQGGIVITASHNPERWNGLKFLSETGCGIDEDEIARIVELSQMNRFIWAAYNSVGKVERCDDAVDVHLRKILGLSVFDFERIRSRKFRVVYDGNNGAGCVVIPRLLQMLGCEVIAINDVPDGRFAHKLEPTPDALVELGKTVKDSGADIGFATDTDADRLVIVDENGTPLSEEFTLAFAVDFVLSKRMGDVVVNLSTSSIIDYIAKKYGVRVYRSKVGELNVARLMRKVGGIIGGEGNGGVIFPDIHYGRDAVVGVALVLAYMSEQKEKVSAIAEKFPPFFMVKDKIEIGRLSGDTEEELIKFLCPVSINREDGLRLELADGWAHIRLSNTEPIVRVVVETGSREKSIQLLNKIKNIILKGV